MLGKQIIDAHLARGLLDTYADDPLLGGMDHAAAARFLEGSCLVKAPADRVAFLAEWKPLFFEFVKDYLAQTDPVDIAIPLLILEGALQYYFATGDATPPLIGSLDAPFLTFYVPFAYGTRIVLPMAASAPASVGVIIHPDHFWETAYEQTIFSRIVLRDRNRLIAMITKWSSIQATYDHANRLARFLYASLPDAYAHRESIMMTQVQIAATLGLSRATISKAIAKLYDQGILETGRGKVNVDTRLLKEYVRTH